MHEAALEAVLQSYCTEMQANAAANAVAVAVAATDADSAARRPAEGGGAASAPTSQHATDLERAETERRAAERAANLFGATSATHG